MSEKEGKTTGGKDIKNIQSNSEKAKNVIIGGIVFSILLVI